MPRGKPRFETEADMSYVDVGDLLDVLEIKYTISHENATFLCPFHHELKPSARMSTGSTAWLCNGCGEKGKNAISFFGKIRGISMSEAKRILEERYGGSLTAAIDDLPAEVARNLEERKEAVEERVAPGEEWVEMFHDALFSPTVWPDGVPESVEQARAYILDRGFSQETLDAWRIGYDWNSNRVTIPVRNESGVLLGFKGRSWEPERHPKYMVLGDSPNPEWPDRYGFQTYRKSEVVFGLYDCEPYPERIIVVEGELNVLAMKQQHWSNVVAVAGAEFSERQAKLIVDRADGEVIIFFDANDAGLAGTAKVVQALSAHMPTRAVMDAPGDAAELDEAVVDELIAGASPTLELQVLGVLPVIDR